MAVQINSDKKAIINDDLKDFIKIEPISSTPKRDDVILYFLTNFQECY